MARRVKSQKEYLKAIGQAPKVRKKVFPMGYTPPKAESMARTGSGQKQSVASNERRMKSALKADMRRRHK